LAGVNWRAHGSRVELRTLTLSGLTAGSKVVAVCKGPGCPFKRHAAKVSRGRAQLAGLFGHRALRPGTQIQLQITAPGRATRIIKITIRAHRKPLITG
jgi:hypothetical protein